MNETEQAMVQFEGRYELCWHNKEHDYRGSEFIESNNTGIDLVEDAMRAVRRGDSFDDAKSEIEEYLVAEVFPYYWSTYYDDEIDFELRLVDESRVNPETLTDEQLIAAINEYLARASSGTLKEVYRELIYQPD